MRLPDTPTRMPLLPIASFLLAATACDHAPDRVMPPPPEIDAATFDAWAWEKRPVVVAGEPDAVAAQVDLLEAEAAGLAERAMIVVPVTGEDAAPASIKERFGIDPAARLTVLLVGKDTGVKRREVDPPEPVTPASLFAEVDRMPMRQREAREARGAPPAP
ncbi:DUF4174 domain-containing protein [Phycisphaera mikurensis]|uniref:DUF4174 domain-containing protein n=1 Tax=Phycisphaera mikurensis (strain NBRC 102666 / KCTC 22515 / FYK2301M01) TaxID=1142394 RepID=I0IH72_PHYMF|nr:DUF4174 domain-containing protein [Phycisphaera mikurensis]MBB6440861.1 hypothetical protein [Phycisphaera mikurensis]BAM04610.1 hypothetical protein PSMK_24510 [Phycisphaera mikurensis NBRC 102666]